MHRTVICVVAAAGAALLFMASVLPAAKPAPPPPPEPAPPGEIFFGYGDDAYRMAADGTGKTLVPIYGPPSARGYGPDGVDRWFLEVRELPGPVYYPGTTSPARELWGVQFTADGVREVQITELNQEIIVLWELPVWSNDGLDSFMSFRGADLATRDVHIYRANVSAALLDAAAAANEDLNLLPGEVFSVIQAEHVPTINKNFLTHSWSPDGRFVTYLVWVGDRDTGHAVVCVTESDELVAKDWDPSQDIVWDVPGIKSLSGNGPVWSPNPDPDQTSILVSKDLDMYALEGESFTPRRILTGVPLVLNKTDGYAYDVPRWSPDANDIVFRQLYQSKKSWGRLVHIIARRPAAGGTIVQLTNDLSTDLGKQPLAWHPEIP